MNCRKGAVCAGHVPPMGQPNLICGHFNTRLKPILCFKCIIKKRLKPILYLECIINKWLVITGHVPPMSLGNSRPSACRVIAQRTPCLARFAASAAIRCLFQSFATRVPCRIKSNKSISPSLVIFKSLSLPLSLYIYTHIHIYIGLTPRKVGGECSDTLLVPVICDESALHKRAIC